MLNLETTFKYSRRNYQVSNIQELVDVAGVDNEFAYAEGKAVREMKRDLESALCSAQDRQQDNGSTDPYKTRGLFKWLGEGGQPADVPAAFQSVASVSLGSSAFTEANMNSLLQDLYEANGMPGGQLTLIAGPGLKRDISDFRPVRKVALSPIAFSVTQPAESKKISLVVNMYEGDFGQVAVVSILVP